MCAYGYGVATISRLLKIIGPCCKRDLSNRGSAKETYNLKEPTNRSHPISNLLNMHVSLLNVHMRASTQLNVHMSLFNVHTST